MRIAASIVIVLFSTPRFLKTKVVLSVSAHSTNPIARYDDGTHKTAGAAFLVVFSMVKGNTMNQRTGIEGRVDGSGSGVGGGDPGEWVKTPVRLAVGTGPSSRHYLCPAQTASRCSSHNADALRRPARRRISRSADIAKG